MWHLNKDLREMKGMGHGNVRQKSSPGWENSPYQGPGAGMCLYVCSIVSGQCSWNQVIQGERVVGKERLGTKGVRLGHAEDLDLIDVSPRTVST